ncbi:sensor histidine kinase [Citrifermentans bremense]|uniref:sensor histidine kinase n=1 Tax=Citrifermentans bremense TaxID=60035 RepID=UPI00040AA070|nr:ATP-binding protein [Citrifermentans bremense]
MEMPLFRLLCLLATATSFLVIVPTNYLHHRPAEINAAVICFGLGTLWLFRRACLGKHHLKTFFFLLLFLLNLVWFPSGGTSGSSGYFFYCLFLYAPIFYRGKTRWLLLVLAVADALALLAAEIAFPGSVAYYGAAYERTADLAVGLVMSVFCCSMMLWVLLEQHDREQQRLLALNQELRQTMDDRACVESSMLQDRELLHAVVDGTTDAVFVKNLQGQYLLFNRAAEVMTGVSAGAALGHDDLTVFVPDVARNAMAKDRLVLDTREPQTLELHTLTSEGEERIFEAIKGPLQDGKGNLIGVFGISRDVTDRRRMAQELRMLNEELELRVVERTARLETAMREQESFSYSVSHDLRGPLRHINCYTAIIEEEFGAELSAEAKRYMDRIRNSSRIMGDLIDDLLELSRIGRLELNKVPVSLSELARGIGRELLESDPARQAELVIEPGLQAHGDRVLLRQLLENLLDNAWKYSRDRGCARIEVGKSNWGEQKAFFVRDNGVGFDMAYQDKLFGAFQRLHGSEFEGTGIGLATVKRIVERHGGTVWAQGEVDAGATIYFTLS